MELSLICPESVTRFSVLFCLSLLPVCFSTGSRSGSDIGSGSGLRQYGSSSLRTVDRLTLSGAQSLIRFVSAVTRVTSGFLLFLFHLIEEEEDQDDPSCFYFVGFGSQSCSSHRWELSVASTLRLLLLTARVPVLHECRIVSDVPCVACVAYVAYADCVAETCVEEH